MTTSGEDDLKRSSHNIMRFGRTAGHNIMRFGRAAGHNIMHFGKRDETPNPMSLPQSEYSDTDDGETFYEYQPMMYNPYRGRIYLKKADRDNVFMHFG